MMTTKNQNGTKTTNKRKDLSLDSLIRLYGRQKEFQSILNKDNKEKDYPRDDVNNYSANTLLLVEEIGELLKEDKRWRTFRGLNYDKKSKKKELADMFIVFLNICMFSDVSMIELIQAVDDKIDVNMSRVKEMQNEQ